VAVTGFGEMAGPTVCEARWTEILATFGRHRDALIAVPPDADEKTGLVYTVAVTTEQLIRTSPHENGNSALWKQLSEKAEREALCKHLDKALFTGMLLEETESNEEFREQRRRPSYQAKQTSSR
jgi:hypothetical protein